MAPSHSRQLLVWSVPTIVALLSYLWFKKRRIGAQSDPGDTQTQACTTNDKQETKEQLLLVSNQPEKEAESKVTSPPRSEASSPNKSFSRSLSGVESSPIDIIIPPQLRATRSTPVVISDEDLDLEIEKVKSMRQTTYCGTTKSDSSPKSIGSGSSSPIKDTVEQVQEKTETDAKPAKESQKKMAQKEIAVVEEKLTALNIGKSGGGGKKKKKFREHKIHMTNSSDHSKSEKEDLQRQSSERDSANHSPSDVMLASPSLSSISDNHSEGSSDSGKGGSDVATPPPSRTPGIEHSSSHSYYEFVIPQILVGKLIGRHGSFVSQIRDKTNAMIVVRKHPTDDKMKVCSVEGTKEAIEKALKMIRDKFPLKRYPEVTLEEVHFTSVISPFSLIPDHLYLKLVEGINNDTILSCLVAPNHLFLQQPTHPSFPSLNVLATCMNGCYNDCQSPMLPNPIPPNTVCAAYSVDGWYRAMVLSSDPETEMSYVKFLDYGGFAYVENSKLRQIRGDFMLLPFQAAEGILANIRSKNEDGTWPEDAYNTVADITKGAIIYTQVADYTEDGVPLVLCYIVIGPTSVVFLNQHLVDKGFAEWVPMVEDVPIPCSGTETTQQADNEPMKTQPKVAAVHA